MSEDKNAENEPLQFHDLERINVDRFGNVSVTSHPTWLRMQADLIALYGEDSEQLYVLRKLPVSDIEKIAIVKDILGQ